MSKYMLLDSLSNDAMLFVNEFGDEIEINIYQYPNEYYVVATICQDKEPFKDFLGTGVDLRRKKAAIKKALIDLYRQAYPDRYLLNKYK